MCIYNAVSGLVCCVPLYCCDTTPASSTSFSINLTWKAACLCPFVEVLQRVLRVGRCVTDTGGAQPTSLIQCKDSPFEPSAWIEHPWTAAVTPWEERPVAPAANWSASSRTNSNKEILVTVIKSRSMESLLFLDLYLYNNRGGIRLCVLRIGKFRNSILSSFTDLQVWHILNYIY